MSPQVTIQPTRMSSQVTKAGTEAVVTFEKSATDQTQKLEESTNGAAKPVDQQAPGNQGKGKGKDKRKGKEKRKGKPGKIHIRLPPIESYQKDLCFAAEAPGRVVVRLERLMGSDKIRPVDGKFMDTLIQRLEEEENVAWKRNIKARKKAEAERHRQLAISGLMEPGPGMQDLYDHPVFRVNRILNRLSTLDSSFSHNPALKLPPIVQTEPFEKDESGAFFKEYPYHRSLRKEWEKYKTNYPEENADEESASKSTKESKSALATQVQSKVSLTASTKAKEREQAKAKTTTSASLKSSVILTSLTSDIEEEDEIDEELEEDMIPEEEYFDQPEPVEFSKMEEISNDLDREYAESLMALQRKYDVPEDPAFEKKWKPFRCELVEKFINDFETTDDMYEAARDIFDLYTRQAITTHQFDKESTTKLIPSKTKSSQKTRPSVKFSESVASSMIKSSAGPLLTQEEEERIIIDYLSATETASSNLLTSETEEIGDERDEWGYESEEMGGESKSTLDGSKPTMSRSKATLDTIEDSEDESEEMVDETEETENESEEDDLV